jgi:hypothetical protein
VAAFVEHELLVADQREEGVAARRCARERGRSVDLARRRQRWNRRRGTQQPREREARQDEPCAGQRPQRARSVGRGLAGTTPWETWRPVSSSPKG